MALQWVAGIIAAYWLSPLTWAGTTSQTHLHIWAAIFLGGAISSLPIALALAQPGRTSTRYAVATGQMLMGALLIHLTGGRIETHFHVFGSLAFLSFYRDWRVLVPATLIVAADHFLRGVFWPQSVYGVLAASEWRWLEHAGWVLFEDTFLLIAIRRSISEMWNIAGRTAESENLNEELERRVTERTAELESANQELEKEVAERRITEAELDKQRAFLRQVIDLNPNFIFAKDREGHYTLVNQATAEAYGTSVEGLMGKTDADFNPNKEEVEWFRLNDLEVMDTLKEKFIPEEVFTDASGRVRWLQTIKRPIVSLDGTVDQMLGVATDITSRKQAEEALHRSEEQLRQAQKMEAVGKLAGGVAHDFNNLLTVINGHSALALRRLKQDDPLYRKLEAINEAGERAASLTRQLLAFSRKQIMQPKVLDLNHVIFETNKMLQRLIGEDIDLLIGLTPDLGKVKADPGQIEQVLMNLSVNARDAMPKGGKLTIETQNVYLDESYASRHVTARPGRYVMLAVSDTGCGMDAATQERIFEPFFTTKGVGRGTGLGLSTVYGIVKQSGGNIWVYSEVGRGTTFKIYLPCVDTPAEEFKASTDEDKAPLGTETVLLVEDEEMVRNMTREILLASGYQVLEAQHGSEALLVAGQHNGPIHLMLSDVVMPQMSGRELAEQLSPIRREMKVLYMSGYTDDAIVHHGVLDEGMAFIEKPFTPTALICKLREVLNMTAEIQA
ncbi:MAG: response regulator [Pyrinomonadaceae bacterium]|nr:response regulator [Pyrinomonadaceae bacterium]